MQCCARREGCAGDQQRQDAMPNPVQSQGSGTVPQNPFWKQLTEILIYLAIAGGAAAVLFCVLYVLLLNALNWLKLRKLTAAPPVEQFKGLRMKKKRKHKRNKGKASASLVYGESRFNRKKPLEKNKPGKVWTPGMLDDKWLHQNPTEEEAFDDEAEDTHNREFLRQQREFGKTEGARNEREAERRHEAKERAAAAAAHKKHHDAAAQLDGRAARTLARKAPENERAAPKRPEIGSAPPLRLEQASSPVHRSAPASARKKRRRTKVQPMDITEI